MNINLIAETAKRPELEITDEVAAQFGRWVMEHMWEARMSFNKDQSLKSIGLTLKPTTVSGRLMYEAVVREALELQ